MARIPKTKIKPYTPHNGKKGSRERLRNASYNARSRRATNPTTGQTIGSAQRPTKPPSRLQDDEAASAKWVAAYPSFLGGLGAGSAAGWAHGKKKYPIEKARYVRITDLGTAGAKNDARQFKANLKRWPHLPKKLMAGSAAVGGGIGYSSQLEQSKIKQEEARLKRQRVKKNDPFGIAKYEKIPSKVPESERGKLGFNTQQDKARLSARARQNYRFTGPHGKENKSIARNWTAGGTAIGAIGGAVAGKGLAGTKKGAAIGAGVGGVVGAEYGYGGGALKRQFRASQRATNESYQAGEVRAPKKNEKLSPTGVIKPKKKVEKSHTSAFGVNHG